MVTIEKVQKDLETVSATVNELKVGILAEVQRIREAGETLRLGTEENFRKNQENMDASERLQKQQNDIVGRLNEKFEDLESQWQSITGKVEEAKGAATEVNEKSELLTNETKRLINEAQTRFDSVETAVKGLYDQHKVF